MSGLDSTFYRYFENIEQMLWNPCKNNRNGTVQAEHLLLQRRRATEVCGRGIMKGFGTPQILPEPVIAALQPSLCRAHILPQNWSSQRTALSIWVGGAAKNRLFPAVGKGCLQILKITDFDLNCKWGIILFSTLFWDVLRFV